MSTLRKNVLANFVGRAWGVVLVYLFIPLYLRFLGVEAYGLVGVYSMLLGVLALADVGLTATLSREMARLSALDGTASEMRDLLRTYESVYLIISLASASIIWAFAPFIAEHWLQAGSLPSHEISAAIRLMGLAIALQLPSGLYNGGLLGLQKQVLSNFIQMAWGVLRGVGTVLVLWLVSPTIFAFAFWQLFSNAVYCVVVRSSLWRALPGAAPRPRFSRQLFRNTWRYAAGMAAMAFFSTLLTQTDKLAVSKMLPLETLGYYTLAGSLASVPLMLSNPIGVAIFPRLTGLISIEDQAALTKFYHRACGLVSVAVLPCALTFIVNTNTLIWAWTGSAMAAQKVALTASLLLGGQIMQAITVVPFYLALAHGQTRLILRVQIISAVLITPLLIFLISRYGVVGGGISWLVMNLCTLIPYMYFLHRRFLRGELQTWAVRDVGRPLIAVLAVVAMGRWFLPTPSSRTMIFGIIFLTWGVASAAAAFTIPELSGMIVGYARRFVRESYAR